ncbi:PQQ-dependent sugar dehydrogenase [Hydrogenophaga sp.]|uniref:PQQ-dependent sugar dehydrogenase n=1 Tax=Hydrogenophaga sp. TaxID=1904254 RepID=UPI003F71D07A
MSHRVWRQKTLSAHRGPCLAVLLATTFLAMSPQAEAARVEEVVSGLQHPWAVAFIEDGRMLVTERPGRIRVVEANGELGKPLEGVPQLGALRAHRGMLDLIVDRDFATNRQLYFCFAESEKTNQDVASTALARARLSADRRTLEDVKVIFSQRPKVYADHHYGCRIVQAPDGHLFLTLGDREDYKENAQKLGTHDGKVVRITTDGKVPAGNPFAGRAGALPETWSYGHRNIQAAAMSPSGTLWVGDHGPAGGDELNVVMPGKNYGWPIVTHGKDYDGKPIGIGTQAEGMEQPVKHWGDMAPSGMVFVTSDRYAPSWKGSLLMGSLRGAVVRLELDGNRVVREYKAWDGRGHRVRDVREAPDGTLWLLTDHPTNGKLLRLRP